MRAIDAWIDAPASEEIAAFLTAIGAEVCVHARSPCYLRCGVEIARVDLVSMPLHLPVHHPLASRATGAAIHGTRWPCPEPWGYMRVDHSRCVWAPISKARRDAWFQHVFTRRPHRRDMMRARKV